MSWIASGVFLGLAVLVGLVGVLIEFSAATKVASSRGLALCSLAMSAIAAVLRMP